jgi:Rad3-related DNA helicase
MLHLGILPNHQSWSGLLRNLRYVVIDEAHNISEDVVKGMSIIISPHTLPLDVFESNEAKIDAIKEKDDFAEYPELIELLNSLMVTCDSKKSENEFKIDALLDLHLSTLIAVEQSWTVCSKTPASLNTFCAVGVFAKLTKS